ncbi:MAG: bifunctional folylpolyglutamate synthase/dihydrofolate synthase [Devosia sp.]|nr:bifunctional folylpolyglutamate synthase/dihydrofolate synthase [Devosia sp.]
MSRTDHILQRLSGLHPKLIDLGLERIERLLETLGRPQDHLPPVIHVAGTNGKGSTIAFLRAFLEAAGHSVHVYTSPHLVRFNERIRLGGQLVSTRRLNGALERVEQINAGESITLFEVTTAAALLLFSETPADFLLLEVGMGGTFDTTNVVAHPLGVVITPVDLDHQGFLGDTIAEIAVSKAGILKRGSPAVIGYQQPEGREVIERAARRLGVAPVYQGEDFHGHLEESRLVFQDENGLVDLPPPALHGPHQLDNASLAIAAVRHFGLPVDQAALERGLRAVSWPARMTPLEGKLRERLAPDAELWLDGGHNGHGAAALARAVEALAAKRPAPLVLIMGMMNTRSPAVFLEPFAPFKPRVLALAIPGEANAHPADAIANAAKGMGLEASAEPSLLAALRKAAAIAGARVIICGSLYLAGHALERNGTPPQ